MKPSVSHIFVRVDWLVLVSDHQASCCWIGLLLGRALNARAELRLLLSLNGRQVFPFGEEQTTGTSARGRLSLFCLFARISNAAV